MNLLFRWFGAVQRDGMAEMLEQPATGVAAALLEPGPEAVDRRRRGLDPTRVVMTNAVARQVLHGWMQNRHQTLLPLTVNFGRLLPDDAELLLKFMAAAMLATSPAAGADGRKAKAFLVTAGAADDALAAFDAALDSPEPLIRLINAVRGKGELAPLAYILLAVVSDTRDPANAIFLQWAAAKLDLPTTVVRSVERRYRR